MTYQIGNRVRFLSEREERYSGEIGVITHTRENPKTENDLVTGATIYPKGDFDYAITLTKRGGIEFVLNVYEAELELI